MSTNTDTSAQKTAKKTWLTRGFLFSLIASLVLFGGSWLGGQYFWGSFTSAGLIMAIAIVVLWIVMALIRYARTIGKERNFWGKMEIVFVCLFWILMLFPACFFLYGFCGWYNNSDFQKLAQKDAANVSNIYKEYDNFCTKGIDVAATGFKGYVQSIQKGNRVDSTTDITTKLYEYSKKRLSVFDTKEVPHRILTDYKDKIDTWSKESKETTQKQMQSESNLWEKYVKDNIDNGWSLRKYRNIADELILKNSIADHIDTVMTQYKTSADLIPIVATDTTVTTDPMGKRLTIVNYKLDDQRAQFVAPQYESEYAKIFLSIPSVCLYSVVGLIVGILALVIVAFLVYVFALPVRSRIRQRK